MKLASYKDGSRDGQLLVVSRDLSSAHYATGIATRLQQVLDDWNFLSPQLQELSQTLNHGKARHAFAFDPRLCLAPLPRAYHWAEAADAPSATGLGRARLAPGRSDHFLGPCDVVRLPATTANGAAGAGLDFLGQLALVTGDIAPGTGPGAALDGVRLLMLANSLAQTGEAGVASRAHDAVAFAPVAVTPDEVGETWHTGRLHLKLSLQLNGKRFGLCNLGEAGAWHAGELLAQLAAVHGLRSGSIVGCGSSAAPDAVDPDATQGDRNITARRAREQLLGGDPHTPWLQRGDTLRMEVDGDDGSPVFGAIVHTFVAAD